MISHKLNIQQGAAREWAWTTDT